MPTMSESTQEAERLHNSEVSNGEAGGRSGAAKSQKDQERHDNDDPEVGRCGGMFKQWVCQGVTVPRGVLLVVGAICIAFVISTVVLGAMYLSVNKAPGPSSEPCPENWEFYGKTCYYFTKEEGDWNSRQRFCVSHNAALLEIDSQEELDFVLKRYSKTEPFIGLRKKGDGYHWVNGSAYNYSLFALQPKGECAHLNPVLIISLGGCHLPRSAICKKLYY